MSEIIDDKEYTVSIAHLKMGDNYKDITRDATDKLKRSLLEDGQIIPMLVDIRQENVGIVIGGNHQYVAIKELIDEGKWLHGDRVRADLVRPKDDNHAKFLALKHNAQYDPASRERIAEWGQPLIESEYPLADIPVIVDLENITLLDVMDTLGPSDKPEKKEKDKKQVECPSCSFKFEI